MTRVTAVTALAFLTFCGTLEAAGWKGRGAFQPPPSISQPQNRSTEGPPTFPDLDVSIQIDRAKGDSVLIHLGHHPWFTPYPSRTRPRLGDRLFPGDIYNVEVGLLGARRNPLWAQSDILGLDRGIRNRMNALSMYVSITDGGGFGFRMLYDRRIRPSVGLNVGAEFTTYDRYRLAHLQSSLPNYTGRVSVIGIFTGLQHRLVDRGRVVPRVGFAAGPVVRVDHQQPPLYGGYLSPYGGFSGTYGTHGMYTGIGLPFGDFPSLSLSFGGYADAGLDVVVGQNRLYAVSLDARYNWVRFFDALGNPGDFGGPALYLGFGRRF